VVVACGGGGGVGTGTASIGTRSMVNGCVADIASSVCFLGCR